MDDLIYDAYSIFFQILQYVAPEHVGDDAFLLICYTFSCIFILIVLWTLFQIISAFSKAVLGWFYRGNLL